MPRLARAAVLLLVAAGWAAAAYAIGFWVLADSMQFAIVGAGVGAIVTAVALGSLTQRVGLLLLAIPIAAAALCASVYLAGVRELRHVEHVEAVVAGAQCVDYKPGKKFTEVCEQYRFQLTHRDGTPVTEALHRSDERTGHDVGAVLDLYHLQSGVLHQYPAAIVADEPMVRPVALVAVPVFTLYVLALAIKRRKP